MASILIRCAGGTEIPADALAGRLERQRPRIEHEVPYAFATAKSPDVEAGSCASPVYSGSA